MSPGGQEDRLSWERAANTLQTEYASPRRALARPLSLPRVTPLTLSSEQSDSLSACESSSSRTAWLPECWLKLWRRSLWRCRALGFYPCFLGRGVIATLSSSCCQLSGSTPMLHTASWIKRGSLWKALWKCCLLAPDSLDGKRRASVTSAAPWVYPNQQSLGKSLHAQMGTE